MELLKQSTDYNCGVFALHFLLQCHGIENDLAMLEDRLKTTEEEGTSHENILAYLNGHAVVSGYDTSLDVLNEHLPAMVNYQYTEEGHYSVALCMTSANVLLYNPDLGAIELVDRQTFENDWFSKLYGNRWFLSIK